MRSLLVPIHVLSCLRSLFVYTQAFVVLGSILILTLSNEITSANGKSVLTAVDVAFLGLFLNELNMRLIGEGPTEFFTRWYSLYVLSCYPYTV